MLSAINALRDYSHNLHDVASNVFSKTGDYVKAAYNREIFDSISSNVTNSSVEMSYRQPEFGTIAAIVLAVAIVGTIVATTRYSKFSFLPKM